MTAHAVRRPGRGLTTLALLVTVSLTALLAIASPGRASAATPATTYYVDSVAGSDTGSGTSPSTPWRSLAKVNSLTFPAGAKVLFKGGSEWVGSLVITSSGAPGYPVTFSSYGTGRARIDGNTTANNTVLVNNAHDVTISNLEVTNSSNFTTPTSTVYRGIYVQEQDTGDVTGVVVQNNYVHDVDGAGGSGGIGEGGIALGVRGNTIPTWFDGAQIIGNEVANINAYGISTFTTWCGNCDIYPAETGIPAAELSATRVPSTGLTIASNYVHDVTGGGITPQYANNALVEYNTVDRAASNQLVAGGGNVGIWWQGTYAITVQYNTVRHTAVGGMYPDGDGQAFDADMGTTNSTVQYNISDNNNGGFFMCLIYSQNNQVRYNLSVGDRRVDFRFLTGCSSTRAYNNTIWGTTALEPTLSSGGISGAPLAMSGIVADGAPTGTVRTKASMGSGNSVADNILYNPSGAAYNIPGQPVTDYSHNDYFDGTANPPVSTNDPAPIFGDPQLVNTAAALPAGGFITPSQFQSYFASFTPRATSLVRNWGVSEYGQAQDALGTLVPVGAADVGAIQHPVTSSASTNLGTVGGAIANVSDGDEGTSWVSPNISRTKIVSPNVSVSYSDARTFDAVTVTSAYGQSQGPVALSVQTWNGSAWITQVASAALTWSSNSSTLEFDRIALPSAVSSTGIRLLINQFSRTSGQVGINEISASYEGVTATNFGEYSPTNSSSNLVDANPATSWSTWQPPYGNVEIDSPAVTARSITLSVAFGQSQGPTSITIYAVDGDDGLWQTVLPATAVSWSSNNSTVEYRTIWFSAPVTATRFQINIGSAPAVWGVVALNDVTLNS